MKESDIEKYLHEEIEKIGGTTRKWVSPGCSGVPDRIVFYKNKVWFVEVKSLGGSLRPVQVREIKRLISHGAIVHTVDSFFAVDNLVKILQFIVNVSDKIEKC